MEWRPWGDPQWRMIWSKGSYQWRKIWCLTYALSEAQQTALHPVNLTGNKCKQCVFTDGSQSTSPAQSSLVIVVGSLRLVSLQEQKIFFFQFCKAEPCNSRAVKWFSSVHLLPIKPASLLFFLVCLLMCVMWHMPSCLYLVWCVWGDKAAMFIFYVQSHLHRSLLGACEQC